MKRRARYVLAMGLAAFALAGCAVTMVAKQEFRRSERGNIKVIALLETSDVKVYEIRNVAAVGVGAVFGAVGGTVVGQSKESQSEMFTRTVREANFDFAKLLTDELEKKLIKAGYKTIRVSVKRSEPRAFVEDYKPLGINADAYLDVGLWRIGYANEGINDTDFRPAIYVPVRMVSTKDGTILYSDYLSYGHNNIAVTMTLLRADKKYYFKSFQSLISDSKTSIEGLETGATVLSDHITLQLR